MKHVVAIAVVVLVLVVIGGAIYLAVSGRMPEEALELMGETGEKRLREPMRPAGGGPRVLIVALDGVGEDELMRALRSGATPHIASVLGAETGDGVFATGYAVPHVLSVLPSTTLAAWTSIFTGEPPAHTGIPGNEFFVREERRFYAPAPVSVSAKEDAVRSYTDDLLGRVLRVRTLYERADVRSYVALSQIYRGADVLLLPDLGNLGEVVLAAAGGVVENGAEDRDDAYRELDLTGIERLRETIRTNGIADLQTVYFPGVDLFTHVAPHPLADQRAYVSRVVDPAVGAILDDYRAAGVLDDTWVVLVSDHGHTPVLSDDAHSLGAEGDDEPPAVLRRAGFRVRALTIDPADDAEDYQATLAYQGAMAYVYLADRSTCAAAGTRCDWSRPPRLTEDVLPVVRAFDQANRTGAHVPALRGSLDLILAREPRATTQPALPFQVWDGTRLITIADYLARTPRPDLLDFERRMHGLAAGPYGHRAGDVLLLARSGGGRPIEERFYFSGEYRSWHGGPDAQDSYIPLVVARRGLHGSDIRARVRAAVGTTPSQLDFMRLVLRLLTAAQPSQAVPR